MFIKIKLVLLSFLKTTQIASNKTIDISLDLCVKVKIVKKRCQYHCRRVTKMGSGKFPKSISLGTCDKNYRFC